MRTTAVEAAREAVREHLDPAVDALQENVRSARKAMAHGREAVEDFAASTAVRIRRRPLASVAVVAAVGLFAGCLLGLVLGRRTRTQDR